MPLAWAHAEYIKLVRSVSDGRVFDRPDAVPDRYQRLHAPSSLEVWNFDRQFLSMTAGKMLRIPLTVPFRLRWSHDGWKNWQDDTATTTAVGIYYVDLPTQAAQAGASLTFIFFWISSRIWQRADFSVGLHACATPLRRTRDQPHERGQRRGRFHRTVEKAVVPWVAVERVRE